MFDAKCPNHALLFPYLRAVELIMYLQNRWSLLKKQLHELFKSFKMS